MSRRYLHSLASEIYGFVNINTWSAAISLDVYYYIALHALAITGRKWQLINIGSCTWSRDTCSHFPTGRNIKFDRVLSFSFHF